MQLTSTKKCLAVIAAVVLAAAYGWADTPILRYSFPDSWDGTGTVVTDLSSGGNQGGIKGTPSLSPTVPSWATMGTQSLNTGGTDGGSILTDNTLQLNNAAVAAAGGFRYDVSFLWNGTHRDNWGSVQKILDYAGTESLQLVTSAGQADLNVRFDDSQNVLSTAILPNTWYSVSVQFDTQRNTVNGNGDLAGVVSMVVNGVDVYSAPAIKTAQGDGLGRGIGIGQLALLSHLVYLDGLVYDPSVSLIPEPTSLSLLGLGSLLLFIRRQKA